MYLYMVLDNVDRAALNRYKKTRSQLLKFDIIVMKGQQVKVDKV